MTNMVEPHAAVDRDDVGSSSLIHDGELATLVRRWMAVGTKAQERVRRESVLRVLPETMAADSVDVQESADPIEPGEAQGDAPREERETSLRIPPLPRRTTGSESERVTRVALLIDARRVSADVAAALFVQLAERSSVNVSRVYVDLNRSDLGEWVGRVRREGMHSFHHFADDDDQVVVAMAIDAVDIARDAAVDEVVIAGDLMSSLPLVHRLHAAGVRVVAVGAAHTPHEVRAACDEFIDTGSIDPDAMRAVGRHRA